MGTVTKNITKIAIDAPLADLARIPVMTNPGMKVSELVLEEILDARQSLMEAMKICDRFGAMSGHRHIGEQVLALDDLLDKLTSGATPEDRWPVGTRVRDRKGRVGVVASRYRDELANLWLLVQYADREGLVWLFASDAELV